MAGNEDADSDDPVAVELLKAAAQGGVDPWPTGVVSKQEANAQSGVRLAPGPGGDNSNFPDDGSTRH
jgi:hypothetical protein